MTLHGAAMPPCPACGREVPADIVFCPYCGTKITQPATPTTPQPSYQPPYSGTSSYPPPSWEMQPRHSHRKYIAAIILIGILAFALGYYIGFTAPIAPDVTILTGNVTLSGSINGTPRLILFYNLSTYYLSSMVFTNSSYQAVLPIGFTYQVTVEWMNLGLGTSGNCTATPNTFSSSAQYATQNFAC